MSPLKLHWRAVAVRHCFHVLPGESILEVGAGSGLVVLEAMKMENELKAASPGIVDSVAVTPGHTVERGAVLVTLRTA